MRFTGEIAICGFVSVTGVRVRLHVRRKTKLDSKIMYIKVLALSLSCIALSKAQPRSQGPLSTSRKYPGHGWSCAYVYKSNPHRGSTGGGSLT